MKDPYSRLARRAGTKRLQQDRDPEMDKTDDWRRTYHHRLRALEICRFRPWLAFAAMLLSGCDRLGELELVNIQPNGSDCSINQSRMHCSGVVEFLEDEDRLSHFSRIIIERKRGPATEAMADRVARDLREAGFYRVRIELQDVFVRVDQAADQCSVDRVPVPCNSVVDYLRDEIDTRLTDPIMVSPETEEFMTCKTKLIAHNIKRAGYTDVVLAGLMDPRDEGGGLSCDQLQDEAYEPGR